MLTQRNRKFKGKDVGPHKTKGVDRMNYHSMWMTTQQTVGTTGLCIGEVPALFQQHWFRIFFSPHVWVSQVLLSHIFWSQLCATWKKKTWSQVWTLNRPEFDTSSMSLPSRISSSFWPADRAQFTPRTQEKKIILGVCCLVATMATKRLVLIALMHFNALVRIQL